MIKAIIFLANSLDKIGKHRDADFIDSILKLAADGWANLRDVNDDTQNFGTESYDPNMIPYPPEQLDEIAEYTMMPDIIRKEEEPFPPFDWHKQYDQQQKEFAARQYYSLGDIDDNPHYDENDPKAVLHRLIERKKYKQRQKDIESGVSYPELPQSEELYERPLSGSLIDDEIDDSVEREPAVEHNYEPSWNTQVGDADQLNNDPETMTMDELVESIDIIENKFNDLINKLSFEEDLEILKKQHSKLITLRKEIKEIIGLLKNIVGRRRDYSDQRLQDLSYNIAKLIEKTNVKIKSQPKTDNAPAKKKTKIRKRSDRIQELFFAIRK